MFDSLIIQDYPFNIIYDNDIFLCDMKFTYLASEKLLKTSHSKTVQKHLDTTC